jgi:hypothetical protein
MSWCRLAEGEVTVLGRRVNLDMGRNATVYKAAREWFHDNPELFAKDVRCGPKSFSVVLGLNQTNLFDLQDLLADSIGPLKPSIPYKRPSVKFLPDPTPERAVAFSKTAFEGSMSADPATAVAPEDLLREHLIHYRQLRDWHETQYVKSKNAPYRQHIDNVIATQRAYMQQLAAAQQMAAAQQAAQQQAASQQPQRR